MSDDKRLERIEVKIDKMSDHLGSIDSTLSAQHESLKDHIRRTELLEGKVTPIEEHVHNVKGAIKFLKIMGVITAIIEALRLLK